MSLLGNRNYTLTIGSRVFENLRVVFEVGAELSELKTAKFQVYGFRLDTVESFLNLDKVEFDLKSGDGTTRVFSGYLYNLEQRKEGPELVTTIHCWSVGLKKEVNKTFEVKSTGNQVITWVKEEFQAIDSKNVVVISNEANQLISAKVFKSGATYAGGMINSIDKVMKDIGVVHVIEDNTLRILGQGNDYRDSSTTKVSAELGNMIGTPSVTGLDAYKRAEVSIVLNPLIQVGSKVNVQSQFFTLTGNLSTVVTDIRGASGDYWVFSLIHKGDTHSDLWTTQMQLRDYSKGEADA
jgi:hypothetical protein